MILSMTIYLETQQVDYTNAFYQAPLEKVIFVELLAEFEVTNKVLLLQKSFYGVYQIPPNLYNHPMQGLESRKSQKSNHDDCLFNNGEIIVLFLVND